MMRLVASEPNATYVTLNLGEIYIADNIKEKSFGLDGRLDELLLLSGRRARHEVCGDRNHLCLFAGGGSYQLS